MNNATKIAPSSTAADGIRCLSMASLLLVVLVSGCFDDGRPRRYPVTGTVKFTDGTPLENGEVSTRQVNTRQDDSRAKGRARILEDGTFQMSTWERHDGLLEGAHYVQISPPLNQGERDSSMPIHSRFRSFTTSGLQFEVSPDGTNEFHIEVTPP